ncbi:MAG: 2-dehydropantoate 2-reductase N-terminal domain-containing protein, partial [Actinomycetes bacterium]
MSRVAMMGSGSWGTAFGMVLADAGSDVRMWTRRTEIADEINSVHRNEAYQPGIELPAALSATTDAAAALDGVDIIALATPAQHLRENLASWLPYIPRTAVL